MLPGESGERKQPITDNESRKGGTNVSGECDQVCGSELKPQDTEYGQ